MRMLEGGHVGGTANASEYPDKDTSAFSRHSSLCLLSTVHRFVSLEIVFRCAAPEERGGGALELLALECIKQ